jgi:hypothetical protein
VWRGCVWRGCVWRGCVAWVCVAWVCVAWVVGGRGGYGGGVPPPIYIVLVLYIEKNGSSTRSDA